MIEVAELTSSRSLSVADLNATINHEPRIKDLRLAEVLMFEQPRKVRDLVDRHASHLERFGDIAKTIEKPAGRGRPGVVNWLNKRQALYICTKSETSVATEVTIQMVEVFDAYTAQRNCQTGQSAGNSAGTEEVEAPKMPEPISRPSSVLSAPRTVTELYAESAHNKALWANTTDKALSTEYLDAGEEAGNLLISTPAQSIPEVILKLTEALEWMSEDVTPSVVKLQSQAIRDLKRLTGMSDQVAEIPDPEPAPEPKVEPIRPDTKVKIDRRARPVTVDGTLYPSIQAASEATGIPYHQIRLRN